MTLFRLFRVGEVTLMLGFPLTGALFALDALHLANLRRIGLFLPATFFLFLAIYCFNEASGPSSASRSARRGDGRGWERALLVSSASALTVAAAMYRVLGPRHAWMALASFVLWSLYSLPKVGLKNFPLTGTVVHLVGQTLHFHMGYLLFGELSVRSLLISAYFALLFSAGHLNHEAIDYEDDRSAGIRTGAVFFGRLWVVRVSSGLFGLAAVYWMALCALHVTTWKEASPFLVVLPLQALTLRRLMRSDQPAGEWLRLYRARYRAYYLGAGLVCAIVRLTSLVRTRG